MEEIVYTREQVLEKIEAIYKRHPYLRNRTPTSECACCEFLDIREEYGHDASGAWEELDSWKWLLGD